MQKASYLPKFASFWKRSGLTLHLTGSQTVIR